MPVRFVAVASLLLAFVRCTNAPEPGDERSERGNDDAESIGAAKTGQYRLREIFGNTYAMDDYVNRAYRWGYMATRFMFERHPENLAAILPMFRTGQYQAYQAYMQRLPRSLDDEFAQWVATATTAGTPQPPWGRPQPVLQAH